MYLKPLWALLFFLSWVFIPGSKYPSVLDIKIEENHQKWGKSSEIGNLSFENYVERLDKRIEWMEYKQPQSQFSI